MPQTMRNSTNKTALNIRMHGFVELNPLLPFALTELGPEPEVETQAGYGKDITRGEKDQRQQV